MKKGTEDRGEPLPAEEEKMESCPGGVTFQGDRVILRTHPSKFMVEFSDPRGKKRPVMLKGRDELELFVRGAAELKSFRAKNDVDRYENNDVPWETSIRSGPDGFLSLRLEVFESQFWVFMKWFRAVPSDEMLSKKTRPHYLATKFNVYFQNDEFQAVIDHLLLIFNLDEISL